MKKQYWFVILCNSICFTIGAYIAGVMSTKEYAAAAVLFGGACIFVAAIAPLQVNVLNYEDEPIDENFEKEEEL